MGTRSRKGAASDGEQKVKGYGLLVYGGMMALGGGILAGERPVFLLVAALGACAFIFGLLTVIRRGRQRLRDDER